MSSFGAVASLSRAIISGKTSSMQRRISHVSEVAKAMDRTPVRNEVDRILHSQTFAGKSQLRKLLEVLLKNIDLQITLKPELVIQELWPTQTRTKRSADVAGESGTR